ncbi:putative disease resistance protein [Nymphaea thermarum]|nr:putative disease resistance protein [Nymphaea thermarum]
MVEPISISITALSLIKGIMKAINTAQQTIDRFKTEYDKLKINLEDLTPRIESVNQFDEEIADRRKNDKLTVQRRTDMTNLVKQLKDCLQLVEKCTHLSCWKYYKINFYTEKLKACNESLNGFATRVMVADIWEVTMTNRRVKYDCSVPEPPNFTVGWTEAVGELKQKLLQEELRVIGICGAGGYGKSTLAKKLCAQIKGKFKTISYISIPRSPDSPTEKKEAESLDWIAMFSQLWDDLVGGRKPEFGSADGAREQLKQCLNKRETQVKGMLVVLDGVWSDSMLERLVIGTPGLKTLVTSRVELNGVNWSYCVQQLSKENAMDLFRHHALLRGPTSEYVDDKLVEQLFSFSGDQLCASKVPEFEIASHFQIVEGCNGHPLALEVIGASLKDAEIREWRSKAKSLQNGQIFDQYEKILWPLYTSLQCLTPIEREYFMDLSSFPNNKRIRAAALMDMLVHTSGQNEDGARAYNILKKLADRHLIELFKRTRNETTDLDKSFGDLFVVQHDLLNELAVYVSRKEMPNKRLTIKQGDAFPDPAKEKDLISLAQIVSMHTGESILSMTDQTDTQIGVDYGGQKRADENGKNFEENADVEASLDPKSAERGGL